MIKHRNTKGATKHVLRKLLRTPEGLVIGEIVRLPDGEIGLTVKHHGLTDTAPIDYLLSQIPTRTTA